MKKERRVAIFDIDGTIFRSSLLIELVHALIERELFPKKAERIFEEAHVKWLDREGDYDAYIGAVVKAFDRYIKGVPRPKFLGAVRSVVGIHKNRVYRYTRDLIRTLKKKKYYLLAVTHSPKYIADAFAKKLGFDKIYGRLFGVDGQGRFTSDVLFKELIDNKAKIVRRAIEKEKLTLKNSIGVGDTESDIPFLELVDHPICFNPNSKLYRRAIESGWHIVIERKDMIYEVQ